MMGSNVVINHSLSAMNLAYKVIGTNLTNFMIERSAGSIFTGGVTLSDLVKDISLLDDQKIGGIGCYVVEGVRKVENSKLDDFYDFCTQAVRVVSEGQNESHFALKLTAFISTELMEKLSLAQHRFITEILEVSYDIDDPSSMSKEQLKDNLDKLDI